ncbi:class I SAM-dependent methyltransferase [Nocardia yamanashiensis]|uniref:class I SAM-dependent methyltransferase n=1 Tax=Nocardia yamanashiensis TaxID=209247 RepID=UPI000A88A193|nr:class I SAM-dependent methyltransferase [Nocardia yamanashiensis]
MHELLDDAGLEQSAVVANSEMNRERRLAGYRRELGFDPVAWLAARPGPQRWLDVGCGSGLALFEAAETLSGRAEIIGLDLVGYFRGAARPGIELVIGSVLDYAPDRPVDLVTGVHVLHYVGDKLGALSRIASWLTADGRFTANFDTASVLRADGSPMGRKLTAALRDNGFRYDSRNRRIARDGHGVPHWEFAYLGADDHAGPNYTGQDGVNAHYAC